VSIHLEHTRVGSWSAIVMQNDAICVAVVPEIGGKIVSLRSLRSGREWLWKNPYVPLRKPPLDATDFGAFDAGGWDEVFPTVSPCRVPNSAWGNRRLTDHGELWFRPWQVVGASVESQAAATLVLAVDEPELPFRFERTLTLTGGLARLVVNYSVTNRSTLPMPYIWAAHPLLAIEPGDSFCIPDRTRVSSTGSIGLQLPTNVTELEWPILPLVSGESLNLRRAPEPPARFAIKLFAENVPGGTIKITNRDQTEILSLSSNQPHAMHIGLWLNYEAWSGASTPAYYNAGVEPTNFPHDDLSVAAREQVTQLLPGSTQRWAVTVSVHRPCED
jgi:galactose mutarotase-like enzyme